MSAFKALLKRDMQLAFLGGGGAFLAVVFFGIIAVLFAFGIGADQMLLSRIAVGVLWTSATLAALLSLDRLFQADYEDGSLDVLALSPMSLEMAAAAKILAHWLTTGVPLVVLSPVLGLMFNLPQQGLSAARSLAVDRNAGAFGRRRDRCGADRLDPPRRADPRLHRAAADHPCGHFRGGRCHQRHRSDGPQRLHVSDRVFGGGGGAVALRLGRRRAA